MLARRAVRLTQSGGPCTVFASISSYMTRTGWLLVDPVRNRVVVRTTPSAPVTEILPLNGEVFWSLA